MEPRFTSWATREACKSQWGFSKPSPRSQNDCTLYYITWLPQKHPYVFPLYLSAVQSQVAKVAPETLSPIPISLLQWNLSLPSLCPEAEPKSLRAIISNGVYSYNQAYSNFLFLPLFSLWHLLIYSMQFCFVKFLVYNVIVQHLNTLQNNHHESSCHALPSSWLSSPILSNP